jgi:menaquinone-specific isochorismate synthase
VKLVVTTEPLDDARPLLDFLGGLPRDHRTAFVHGGEGIVTGGSAVDLAVTRGAGRFVTARRVLEAIARDAVVDDQVRLPGSGLVAVGSFTFDDGPEDDRAASGLSGPSGSVLRVPRVLIGRRDGRTWRTEVLFDGASDPTLDDPDVDDRVRPAAPVDRPRYAGSTLDDASWLEAVDEAVRAIRGGRLAKVVLARDVRLWSRTAFPVPDILRALAERFPSCFTFLVDGLVGASPELLLRREGPSLASRVLAGTTRRSADPEEDTRLGADLLASVKDRWEHDLAARSASEVLGPLCSELDVPDGPSLVRLDNVQHLGSDLEGILARPVHVLDVLELLHPTAAVAGTPRADALALIRELERMDRGRYAGPVGWCDAEGDGEFAIALRCAEIDGDRARLFAGAGIVDGSLPETELMETWLKMRAMTDVLSGP